MIYLDEKIFVCRILNTDKVVDVSRDSDNQKWLIVIFTSEKNF